MIRHFFDRVYGSSIVSVNLRGQRSIPYLPEEKLRALRDKRLRKMVRYAAETVPYYRDFFRKESIDPGSIKTARDLHRLPLLEKNALRRNPHRFLSTSKLGKKSMQFSTSGSTGEPTRIYHDLNSLLANIAYGERERSPISALCGKGSGFKKIYIVRQNSTVSKVWNFYRQNTFIPSSRPRWLLNVLQPIEQVVNAVNSYLPDVIISYGSYLEALFRTLKVRESQMHLPSALLYGGDSMSDGGKAFIEKEFNIPVLSVYDAVESFKLGFACEARRGFHLHDDLCHVRVVDADGNDLPPGKKGQVVISNLINKGTVLLNYCLGDLASLSVNKCPCGRTLPLLSTLEGRVEDIIVPAKGGLVHPRAVWALLSQRNEIMRYQLIQYELDRFELKLVTVDHQPYRQAVEDIVADLHRLLGESSKIGITFHKSLEPEESGKFRPVISKCRQDLLT